MEELINAIQDLGKISWIEYIQLVATVISIIISGLAVYCAVKVPKKIADEQNKIALLEKRTEIYLYFVDMFKSHVSWPLALANACGTSIKRVDVWNNDVRNTFSTAGFLFSSSLKTNVEHLMGLYSKIRWYDGYIDIGLECINNEDDKNRLLQLFAKDGIGEIDESETEELISLTSKYEFVYNEVVGEAEYEYVTINLYTLSEEQNVFAKEARELQDVILAKMQNEIQISNK